MTTVSSLRPLLPADLNPDEVAKWVKLVACKNPSWWTEKRLEHLAEYCRLIVQARRLNAKLNDCSYEDDPEKYLALHGFQCRISEQMIAAYDGAFE